jgi:hypothetical protein
MGTIPAGPPVEVVGLAFIGALEGTVIALAGRSHYDELFVGHAAAGALGLAPDAVDVLLERNRTA